MEKITQFSRALGLHLFVGFGMFAVDAMLIALDVYGPGGWVMSAGVAALLTLPCVLIQRFGQKDEWGLAIGKGLMIGCLTAIPAPIFTVLTLATPKSIVDKRLAAKEHESAPQLMQK